MAEASDEFAHPVFDRTYLVSTSRVARAAGEGLQTIHVLKDLVPTDVRRSAVRELFDNIQEGLFFSTPAGRFIEVNDAMVRMLGYATREELLQIDISTQLYLSAEHREQHAEVMKENGYVRNFEGDAPAQGRISDSRADQRLRLYDKLGRLLQMRGLMLDVTGLRTYQSELHRERDFSSKILSNTQSLILGRTRLV